MRGTALPDLSSPYRLSRKLIESFRRDGHVKLDGVFTRAEIAAYRRPLERVIARHSRATDTSRHVPNLGTRDGAARRFVLSRRLGRIAADLLGADTVRVLSDVSFFKGPRCTNTPWHQDASYTPIESPEIVSLWIPLTDLTPALAPMSYASASHRDGFIGTTSVDDGEMDAFEADLRARGYRIVSYGRFAAGDLAVHAGWTLHAARTNTSSRTREVIVVSYFADGARVAGDPPLLPNPSPSDLQTVEALRYIREPLLPGLDAGELAAGPLTPLVFERKRNIGSPRARAATESLGHHGCPGRAPTAARSRPSRGGDRRASCG